MKKSKCSVKLNIARARARRTDGRTDGRTEGTRAGIWLAITVTRSSLNSTHPNDGLLSFLSSRDGGERAHLAFRPHPDDLCLGSQLGAATSIVSTTLVF